MVIAVVPAAGLGVNEKSVGVALVDVVDNVKPAPVPPVVDEARLKVELLGAVVVAL